MQVNLDEILKPLVAVLSNAATMLSKKERETMALYLSGLKERFLYYVNQSVDKKINYDTLTLLVKGERIIVKDQVISLGIILGSNVEEVIKDSVDKLAQVTDELVIPIEYNNKLDITLNGRTENINTSKSFAATPGTITPTSQTQFGLFASGELSTSDLIILAKKLGVNVIRVGLNMDSWDGKNVKLEQLLAAGFKVILTLNWNTIRDANHDRVPQPWARPDQLNDYSNKATDILTKYPVFGVVCENEETVNLFHSGIAQDYIPQLAALSKVCRKLGIPVTNGGLTNPGLQILAYRNLVQKNKSIDADNFYNKCMDQRIGKAAKYPNSNKELEAKATETEYLLQNYGKLVDFVNIHWYEPLIKSTGIFNTKNTTKTVSPGALKAIVEYITDMTGKPVISNETGTLNGQSELVPAIMQDMQAQGVKVCVWFSATSDNGQTDPLNSGTDLTKQGEAFKAFIN